jgi:signal transduction histidine kinase
MLRAARQWRGRGQAPTLAPKDPLVEYLHWRREPLVTEELTNQVRAGEGQFQAVAAQLKHLDAAVVVPSFVEDRCMGFLVLGEKKSGTLYTPDDLQVFQVLANQAALAIENAQFYEDLKQTQAELFQTAKMASLGQMAGGMSHQINNRFYVLAILAGTLKSVLKDIDPAAADQEQLKTLWGKILETLNKVEGNAIQGGDIVKTLLRFSRPGRAEAQPISPQEIVGAARDIAQYKVDLNSVDLVQEWPQELPPVMGNLNQLADCFFNLITNAYDAIQAKLERMKPADYRGRITISGHTSVDGMVTIDVQDNGIGMTAQEMEQLFVPFFTTKATAEKGTGLGLFVIKRILEHHGGNIEVQSSPGQGTAFTVYLPSAGGASTGASVTPISAPA